MVASFAFLNEIRPYTTSWRVQVKILHSWRQYTRDTGETLELVLADEKGVKIHATINKDLVSRYANQLPRGEWIFIETFGLTNPVGDFRPTNHVYKMKFQNGTVVSRSEPKSDSAYLTLANFRSILNRDLNENVLVVDLDNSEEENGLKANAATENKGVTIKEKKVDSKKFDLVKVKIEKK